jgi:hypothetical protein
MNINMKKKFMKVRIATMIITTTHREKKKKKKTTTTRCLSCAGSTFLSNSLSQNILKNQLRGLVDFFLI